MNPLSPSQIAAFHKEGYSIVSGIISPDLLRRLNNCLDELIFRRQDDEEVTAYEVGGQAYVHALEKVCRKGDLSCLELLGLPELLAAAEALCGPDFFMIQEFAVVKMLGDPTPVLWHQDMANERTGTCITMGIYLDDAHAGDGALRIVPGSHANGRSICESRLEPSIEVPMRAGDILIHDMMLAHSSGVMTHNPIRKVLYFEFIPASQVLREEIYEEALVERRTRLIPAAIRHYQTLHPATAPFPWKNPRGYAWADTDLRQTLHEIYAKEIHARPSAYCLEGFR